MAEPSAPEPILEPDLPIVDPHHHLWFRPEPFLTFLDDDPAEMPKALTPVFRRRPRYLFDELLADLTSGHNIRATVFIEADSMHRLDGPEHLRSVGEVEFAAGMGAIAASGVFTDIKVCAGIVGGVDLRDPAVEEVLAAHIKAGGGRYRGVRAKHLVHDPDPLVLGCFGGAPQVMSGSAFRQGFARLAPLGLSYEAWQLEYQLPELIDLARAFPETQFIVNHAGGLLGRGRYRGQVDARFAAWRDNIRTLAAMPHVAIKLGGLGMGSCGFAYADDGRPAPSQVLAQAWRPYVETCIEAFGADRCLFESNFPVDAGAGAYAVVWNAFKRITAGASATEKAALYAGTAARIYRLEL